MITRRLALALSLTLIAGAAFAQSADEFGRASAGLIELSTKSPSRFDGSLSATTSRGFGASFGGPIVKDRMWFFGTAQRMPTTQITQAQTRVPQIDTNWQAALGDRNAFTATTSRGSTIPSSFLSLHYTGIVSSNMFFTAKVSSQTISPNRPLW